MTLVLIGLGGIWVGSALGLILGGLLANSKSRDLESAYQRLSVAIHQYLEDCARQGSQQPPLPTQLVVLRRVVSEADGLAGLDQDCDEPIAENPPPESLGGRTTDSLEEHASRSGH